MATDLSSYHRKRRAAVERFNRTQLGLSDILQVGLSDTAQLGLSDTEAKPPSSSRLGFMVMIVSAVMIGVVAAVLVNGGL